VEAKAALRPLGGYNIRSINAGPRNSKAARQPKSVTQAISESFIANPPTVIEMLSNSLNLY
jgi:hypothetical protein